MNKSRREVLRDTVLRAFEAAGGCGLNLETLLVTARACGFRQVTVEELEADVLYFADKGLVAEVTKTHSKGNRVWRITAAGVDDLEERGF